MRGGGFEDGGDRTTQTIRMADAGAEVDEFAGQGAGHDPASRGGAVGGDVAEGDQQAGGGGLVVQIAADDLEFDQEALLVVDDFGLGAVDFDVLRGRTTGVFDAYAEGEGFDRLNGWGEWVVAINVLGQEVVEGQQGQGFDVDGVGRDGDGLHGAADGVIECGANEVEFAAGGDAAAAGGGDDEPVDVGGGGRGDLAVARNVVDAGHGVEANEERGAGVVGV